MIQVIRLPKFMAMEIPFLFRKEQQIINQAKEFKNRIPGSSLSPASLKRYAA